MLTTLTPLAQLFNIHRSADNPPKFAPYPTEVGTAIRKTNKGYNRGQITGLNFFFAARQSSDGEINSAIASSIEKQLNRIMK